VSGLLFNAFRALWPGPTRREIATVAKALRESGHEETLALFRPPGGEYFDRGACDAVIEVAEEAGAGPFVGLDLYTEVIRPGWRPFSTPGANDRAADAFAASTSDQVGPTDAL
jgi:hypothetical protein